MSESKNGSRRLTGTPLRSALGIAIVIGASACGGPGEPDPTATQVPPGGPSGPPAAPASTTIAPSAPSAPAATTSTTPDFTKIADIEYATKRKLDVYVPVESAGRPVVVVVHGLGQGRRELRPLAEAIAAEGTVVFNISTVFSVPPLDGIENISCAIRFARATAGDYGGDPSSITLVGYSSGAAKGSIVAMDGDAYQRDCVVTDGSALPDALVGYEGPFDYATHVYGSFNVSRLEDEDPAMWRAVNPYSHIGGNSDLIIRLIHGRDDDTAWYDVPPEVSAEFHQALSDAGYDVELTYVEGATHGSLRPGTEAFEVTVQQVLEVVGN
jgi:acetyl esterase/lipase